MSSFYLSMLIKKKKEEEEEEKKIGLRNSKVLEFIFLSC
jgi:hypothetical protein